MAHAKWRMGKHFLGKRSVHFFPANNAGPLFSATQHFKWVAPPWLMRLRSEKMLGPKSTCFNAVKHFNFQRINA